MTMEFVQVASVLNFLELALRVEMEWKYLRARQAIKEAELLAKRIKSYNVYWERIIKKSPLLAIMALSGSNPVGYTQENAHYLHHMPTKPDEPRVLLYSWGDYIEPDGPPTGHRMPFDQHRGASWSPGKHPQRILSKTKRGLPGFVNGARVSALPDTGCSRNTVSLAFAQDMKLAIRGSPADFKLGNSTYTKSLGRLIWSGAFSIYTALMLPQVP